ncbi:MAG TPA: RHS repeat-associated core domain-containing protein [Acidobacteriaceae bacterium]|jgi:RHS repeat-associated protein|nr:RHS repeat-associated core domain-containing protein [Acidobacteriaceae bacterium]
MTLFAACEVSAAFLSSPRSTGKERDTESGLDYFGARYYGFNMGRFMSPDWSAQADPVPYANLENPQSLNLYAYVGNNPLRFADPDGHLQEDEDGNVIFTATGDGACDVHRPGTEGRIDAQSRLGCQHWIHQGR